MHLFVRVFPARSTPLFAISLNLACLCLGIKQDIIIGFLCDREIGVCSLHLSAWPGPPLPAKRSAVVSVLSVPTDIDIPWRSSVMLPGKATKPGRRYR